jgi:acrylyl-CoA reductase (NADPH)
MERFTALMIRKQDASQSVALEELPRDALMDGDVVVRVEHSTLNYKDGLALTGRSPIVRRFPMIGGVDLAGTVESAEAGEWRPGERVIVNGWGLSETHYGGYAELARVKSEWLVPCPPAFTTAEAMAIGTAGYTAMLGVLALEDHDVTPERGPVLVTGAAGGVGSIAVALLSKLGYTVQAATGRPREEGYLKALGAAEIIGREELLGDVKPLAKQRWAGALDVVGGRVLANVLSAIQTRGAVAACGLAGGMDLPTTVAPFILRGVTLAGIESVYEPRPRRIEAWTRLARDLDKKKLAKLTRHVGLADVPALAPEILAGRVRGRIVVDIASAAR